MDYQTGSVGNWFAPTTATLRLGLILPREGTLLMVGFWVSLYVRTQQTQQT